MTTVLFGAAGVKYGLKGVARDVPVLNDALTKTIKENYTPEQLRDIYTRVSTTARATHRSWCGSSTRRLGSPGTAVRAGARQWKPRSPFLTTTRLINFWCQRPRGEH